MTYASHKVSTGKKSCKNPCRNKYLTITRKKHVERRVRSAAVNAPQTAVGERNPAIAFHVQNSDWQINAFRVVMQPWGK